jgi:cellobiose-specific phosphotransferase system component IIB
MMVAYLAKKRAEIAPGVGTETDIFLLGPQVDANIVGDIISKLETEYKKIANIEKKQLDDSKLEISSHVKALQAATTSTQQEARKPDGSS